MDKNRINMRLIDKYHKENIEAIEFCKLFIDKNIRIPKFIYGINKYALSIMKFCQIDGFIDDFFEKREYFGKPVLRLSQVPKDSLIVIAVVGILPLTVRRKTLMAGLRCLDYFAFCKYSGLNIYREFLFDFDDFIEDVYNHREDYEKVYELLADEESRDVFYRLTNFRFYYDLNYLEPFMDNRDKQYFEDFLRLNDGEIFIDIGGFEGETTIEFIKRCPSYKAVYFFEPDKDNFLKAKERLEGYRDVHLLNIGLYNTSGTVRFQQGRDASKISNNEGVEILVDKLDNIIHGAVTFMKMDVEGVEQEVIEGAKNLIIKNKPKLAIAVYHRFDDLREIPQKILSICDRYSIYLRHYTEGVTETIMYFIPK